MHVMLQASAMTGLPGLYQWHAMGTPGATAERDGFAQMGHLISLGGLDIPICHEQHYPVRYQPRTKTR